VPNRHASTSEYRYGFNDKEKDDEVKGEGNWQEYGMRMYDPRVGRFPNVDSLTKKYPELTPYQFASNTPIQAIDLDGLEAYFMSDGTFSRWGKNKSANAPVIVISNNKEIVLQTKNKQDMTFGQFMNRVEWGFGESAGDKSVSKYYAHAIDNLSESKRGNKSYKNDENEMYENATTGSAKTPSEGIDFVQSSKGWGYKLFRDNFRKNASDLDGISNINGKGYAAEGAKEMVKETIGALTGTTEDPTKGATNWAGDGCEDWVVKHSVDGAQVTIVTAEVKTADFKTIINKNGKKSKVKSGEHNTTHSFYKLGKSTTTNIVRVDESGN
jgi:RHS repeat-associated protein